MTSEQGFSSKHSTTTSKTYLVHRKHHSLFQKFCCNTSWYHLWSVKSLWNCWQYAIILPAMTAEFFHFCWETNHIIIIHVKFTGKSGQYQESSRVIHEKLFFLLFRCLVTSCPRWDKFLALCMGIYNYVLQMHVFNTDFFKGSSLCINALCTWLFIFTSGSWALLGRLRCVLSIWLSLLTIFKYTFLSLCQLFSRENGQNMKILEVHHFGMRRKWPPMVNTERTSLNVM